MGGLDSFLGVAKFLMSSQNEKLNTINKGITECRKINSVDLFKQAFHINTVISGTAQFVRNMMLKSQIMETLDNGVPVVCLHSRNSQLPMMIQQSSNGRHDVAIVNSTSGNYSPFLGMQDYDAIDVILDSIPEKYDVKQNARYYLEAVSDIMQAKRISASFNNYLTCPHDTILDRIDQLIVSGQLTDFNAQTIRSKIMIGQSEYYKIDSFLHGLSKQMGKALHKKKTNIEPVSMCKAINEHGFISIDIGASFNSIYFDFIIEQLKLLGSSGNPFILVLDSISFSENKKIKEFIKSVSDNIRITISCDDLLASCGGNEDLFNTMIALSKRYFIFQHTSAISAGKWSNVLGEYERLDENISRGKTRMDDGMGIWSLNNDTRIQKSHTVSVSKKRDYIIPPEKIVSMQNNEVYIRSEFFKGIRHGYIVC